MYRSDISTYPPQILTASNSFTGGPNRQFNITYYLNRTAYPSSVKLYFEDLTDTAATTIVATLDATNGFSNTEVAKTNISVSVSGLTYAFLDHHLYKVTLSYQDSLGNPAANVSISNVTYGMIRACSCLDDVVCRCRCRCFCFCCCR